MTSSIGAGVVVSIERLAQCAKDIAAAQDAVGDSLVSTLRSMSGASASVGGASAAWDALVDRQSQQQQKHAAQGTQLANGLQDAARLYAQTDALSAQSLQSQAGVTGAPGQGASSEPVGSAVATTDPSPSDTVPTPYGELGQWMINSSGAVADWLGRKTDGKSLYEPINVVLVDNTSTTPAEAVAKLNRDLAAAGFNGQSGHSGGYSASIGGTRYGQLPDTYTDASGPLSLLETQDHARMFGPAPAPGGGYIWTSSFSREKFSIDLFDIAGGIHGYDSFNTARDNLLSGLVNSGATELGTIPMGNTRSTAVGSTGDHDGNAVVIQLE
ncbi:MAG: WXG100 family type VII secretion target [Segniliparus sp.]|uniref:WXG100 family type VII secretion target n=1 Tax=Segniliparus sp. TaxID=2804064 RepID=UPI003F3C9EEC